MKLIIYPGSFRPFHLGHLNILEKTESIFGRGNVLIAIGVNLEKETQSIEDLREKAKTLSIKIGREVEVYTSFLHEFIEEKEKLGYDVTIIRGLRNGDDLAYENNQYRFISEFKKDVKYIYIMCDKNFEHISSTAIRNLESFREGSSKNYLI